MEEVNFSASASRPSISSFLSSRASAFSLSSSSHHAFFVASAASSSPIRVIMFSIISFTLSMGSAFTRSAKAASSWLCSAAAFCCRKSATFVKLGVRRERSLRSRSTIASAVFICSSVGKCFSALPVTASPEMMSMALPIASNSSERSVCRLLNSAVLSLQLISKSFLYFASSFLVAVVSSNSPWSLAFWAEMLAFSFNLLSLLFVASLFSVSRPAIKVLNAFFFSSSAFFTASFSSVN
mmetsp:Transcript_55237/g.103565  ORF Transcript_55237/g.103565 Transcript_55237/m.103565 type:complete len:239 (-) Transcript_55237:714-1430(-)